MTHPMPLLTVFHRLSVSYRKHKTHHHQIIRKHEKLLRYFIARCDLPFGLFADIKTYNSYVSSKKFSANHQLNFIVFMFIIITISGCSNLNSKSTKLNNKDNKIIRSIFTERREVVFSPLGATQDQDIIQILNSLPKDDVVWENLGYSRSISQINYARIDLDGDEHPEVLLTDVKGYCGAGSCSLLIFKKYGDVWKPIDVWSGNVNGPIYTGIIRQGGWLDLLMTARWTPPNQTAWRLAIFRLAFDGRKYKQLDVPEQIL